MLIRRTVPLSQKVTFFFIDSVDFWIRIRISQDPYSDLMIIAAKMDHGTWIRTEIDLDPDLTIIVNNMNIEPGSGLIMFRIQI